MQSVTGHPIGPFSPYDRGTTFRHDGRAGGECSQHHTGRRGGPEQ
ncbi:hypothetical protein T261_6073 [Streptomyces lydicus]|nr:hypothetical protein T261_6073 [Streptomyces lydicus]